MDITAPDAAPYPGWPIAIKQDDNYGKKAVAYLPTLEVTAMTDPVVQVIDESSGEIVYTLRIKGTSFRPKIFRQGQYTVRVDDGDNFRLKKHINALPPRPSSRRILTMFNRDF